VATFMRENSGPVAASVLLHALLAAALVGYTLISLKHTPAEVQPIPIDAEVVDSQVLRQAQQALADRAAQEAARARAAAEAQAAARAKAEDDAAQAAAAEKTEEAERAAKAAQAAQAAQAVQAAAEVKREADAKHLQDAHRAAEALEAKQAEDAHRAAETKRIEDAKQAEEAKRAAALKQAEEAKRAADSKAKAEREAELRRQLADEEHVNAVTTGPLRDQYIARLQSRIQNAWIRPPSARVGLDCLVQVTQVPGGEVTAAQVTQCNGDAVTRESIENAVYRASPLPMPSDPALFSRTFAFHFHPDQ
jgi:colicin import membrane protein